MTPNIFPIAMLCLSVAAISSLFSRREPEAHPSRPESSRALYFYTGLGLLLGFGFMIMPVGAVLSSLYGGLPWLTIIGLDDVTLKVVIVVGLLALVLYGERRPLRSIGIIKPHLADVALGVGAFVVGEVAMYLMESLLPHGFATGAAGHLALFARLPLWLMLLGSLVNGIFEEMTARGFAVERLSEVTHSTIAGAGIALVLNLMTHIPYWGWRQTIILAPQLATFLALYLWRRSVVPCAIGHIIVDAFPRIVTILSAIVWMSFTPYLSYDRQGSTYYRKGDFNRSIQLFTRALARDPHDSYAYQWRGLAYLNQKDYAKSLSELAEAIRIEPTSSHPYAHRAFVYSTKGDNQHAIADLDQAIRLDPEEASSYEMRARIESRLHDYNSAGKDYLNSIRLEPSDADLYDDLGNVDYRRDDIEAAIKDYSAAVRFSPGNSDAWINLAKVLNADRQYQSALDAVAHGLKIDPRSSSAYNERALAHQGQKKFELALADVNQAIALDPDDPDLYLSLLVVRALLPNDVEDPVAYLDKEVARYPHHSGPLIVRARMNAVDKKDAAAIADFSSSIALKPGDSSLFVQRGEMYYRTHDYAKAIADWKKALELKHDDSATYNQMAWLLATSADPKARDGKKAIEFATRSCELSLWKDGEAVDTLAAAYAETGDFERAVEFENKAIALMNPEDDTMKEARARLALYEHRQSYRETPS